MTGASFTQTILARQLPLHSISMSRVGVRRSKYWTIIHVGDFAGGMLSI
jgi:hypothetical protein